MKQRIALIGRILLGIIFIFSAYTKFVSPGLIEIILTDHAIASTREIAGYITRILIGIELGIGILFLQPYSIKKTVLPVSIIFLSVFTIYLMYTGLILKDQQNCGCFGEMIKMSPVESIVKNLFLIAVSFFVAWNSEERKNKLIAPALLAVSLLFVFIFLPIRDQKNFKFARYTNFEKAGRVDLSEGDNLLAVLNTECDHCRNLASELYKMRGEMKNFPALYMLLFTVGSVSADSFRSVTHSNFPYKMIGMNEFLNLIGQSPPRIYWLKSGSVNKIWDEEIPLNIKKYFTKP